MHPFWRAALAAPIGLCAAVPAAQACTSCGCTFNAQWADGRISASPGLRLGLRYDFIDQNHLYNGSERVEVGAIAFPTDREIQQGTLTRYYTLSADYGFASHWAVSLQLPWLDREHQTIDEGETETATSHTRGFGDLRASLIRHDLLGTPGLSLQFGLKLPTGRSDAVFDSGPLRGEIIDRGLQAGSGTTDVVLGLSYAGVLYGRLDGFAQAQLRQPLDRADGFRPSTEGDLNLGLRWRANRRLTPQLQLNAKIEGRETGAEADYDNSGSTVLFLSPGATFSVDGDLALYGFVQLPVYEHYSGDQLAPDYLLSTGISYRFGR